MDDLIAKEFGRMTLAALRQAQLIEQLRADLASRDRELAKLRGGSQHELPMTFCSKGNGHAQH